MKLKSIETIKRTKSKAIAHRNDSIQVHALDDQRRSGPRSARTVGPSTKSRKNPKLAASPSASMEKPFPPLPPPETTTTIEAKIDVGYGNTLFIRGDTAGLNWEKGVPMECVDASTWVWSSRSAEEKVAFRLLINDDVCATSITFFAVASERTQVVPHFP